jgi:hypothetical protein
LLLADPSSGAVIGFGHGALTTLIQIGKLCAHRPESRIVTVRIGQKVILHWQEGNPGFGGGALKERRASRRRTTAPRSG